VLEILSYPPVLRGLILLCIAGFTFPLGGIFILRMNLLPLRFLMMHGVLLGGAMGLAFGWDLSITTLAVNLLLIFALNRSVRALKSDYGHMSMFFMITSIALALLIISKFRVPAKDTMVLLWGSLYTNDLMSLLFGGILGLALVLFSVFFFRQLTALFHDRDIALSLGIRVPFFELMVMLLIALVVASAMRLMGALLLDALILLPVITASFIATGLKKMMVLSSLFGGLFAVSGFFISLYMDIPVSAGASLPAALIFLIILILQRSVLNGNKA